jgi:3-oxoadipate enol-lactonase
MRNARGGIAWHEHGPTAPDAGGEPVLMIMGLAASSRLWYRLVPWLSRDHRVLLFDNRGTGHSRGVRSRLTMAGLASDAVAVLDDA